MDPILAAWAWALIVPSALLLPVYAVTFYKVWNGSRFKLVLVLITLLSAAAISFLVSGIGQYGQFLYFEHDSNVNPFTWEIILAVGIGVGNFCFNTAHWLLAFFYFKMVKNMPRVAKNQTNQVKDYRLVYWLGLILNAAPALAFGIYFAKVSYANMHDTGRQKWLDDAFTVSSITNFAAQLVSGCILLWSVYNIHAFMSKNQFISHELNVKSLCYHASAFSLFVVSIIIFTGFYANYALNPTNDGDGFEIAGIVMQLLSFIS